MKIDVLTLFPEMFEALNHSILKRASDKKLIEIRAVNIRDYAENKHKKCDDYPFGGGAGMVMMAQPVYAAFEAVDKERTAHRIYMSPKGKVLDQSTVERLSKFENLVILCGHYEGVDQRVLDLCVDEEISIGDYVLTGGELPAMVLIDTVSRYIPEVLGSSLSLSSESFSDGMLEYPQYTRPQNFMGLEVPEILLSGNHKEIETWRREQQLAVTKALRPDLLEEK